MKVTSLIFLAASATVVAASDEFKPKVKLINRRDAMPIPGVFMNAVQAVPALRKRDLGKPLELAEAPGKVQKRNLLEARQWGCETVGQINCSFEGCCKFFLYYFYYDGFFGSGDSLGLSSERCRVHDC